MIVHEDIPTEYLEGLAKAKTIDPELAERYIRHTKIGDFEADAVIAEFQSHPAPLAHDWIRRGIESGASGVPDAPAIFRDFLNRIEEVPAWFDQNRTLEGCRAFHRNSEMFIGAFVADILIEGFCTLISKSFSITGRLTDQGVRRLKENNRHLLEIFLPGGLSRHGDGWKLSVRIRLMHARVRLLLSKSDEWDAAAWGTPLSASHIAFAASAFSALLLERAQKLGVRLSIDQRESFMLIWRYSAHLMGVRPDLLFETEADALRFHKIGAICEPPPSLESIVLANCLINSAPIVASITNPAKRRKVAKKIYRVSRALIGDKLADQLRYPPYKSNRVLTILRWKNRLNHFLRLVPALDRRRRSGQFARMLDISSYPAEGIRYRMPEHLHAEKDKAS
jgi:hypothetical protein